ncbi:DUF418 domain-containing protein [Dyella sp. C11]|uniref:DUF418 domain-containing protein n=1 Tax=Dyella sp. C11 TaxID=2126991 RepID=UPI000D65775B|nr:DUF418 domain-containing protein [Dyella sp. C11]
MVFSNYARPSGTFGWGYFGGGGGCLGRMSPACAMALGVAVYAVQVVTSRWWLRRYRFGPMEWVWRVVMYGTRQPWKISAG